ncbi:MAG: murein biosynthesis integral membrane protein MurJ [Candidatus Moranbacteria bacterium]|nr:murein biosynthesis integral membrane protein MurJ [Candidatus Moranbacteria bacterium]
MRLTKRISDFFDTSSSGVGRAAFIIAAAGILSRLLGFLRDRMLAGRFGAGDTLDVYYAAFRIPDTLYNLLVMGALSAAFVPIFTEFLSKQKRKEAFNLAAGVLEWMILVLGALSLLAIFAAPAIVPILAPGFSDEKREMTVVLTRIMLLSPLFLGASAVFGGMLLSFRRFMAYSFAPILYNFGIIVGVMFFVPMFGMAGLAWGVALGALMHMVVQVPSVAEKGFFPSLFRRRLRFDGPVRRVVMLMIPRTLGIAANQLSLFLTTVFASLLAPGSLAIFTLASNIGAIPIGLFAVSFSLAAFPTLSFSASEKRSGEFFDTLSRTTKRILFFVVPVSMLFIVYRAQVVRIVLGSGQFDWDDTIATFNVLALLSVSLFAQGIIPLFARAFYALQDTKTPLYIAVLGEATFIGTAYLLLPAYGTNALAIAFSLGNTVNFILLLLALRGKVEKWDDSHFFRENAMIFLAAILAGIVAQLSKSVFVFFTMSELDTFAKVFMQLAFGSILGLGTFLLLCHWFRIEEYHSLRRFILSKVLRSPEAVSSVEGHPEKGGW